ncbi:hypothetical protein Q8A67_011898 [Cirrhinus molitorella]|uniref:Uncharacterized protein n=1 Tax=Cirrhinus molitorella TaxID=172907 RepID=A0AA88PLD3_9TELE|nr:hypothetical protein Q8A67_011898 [Cirrhinus molitorella]
MFPTVARARFPETSVFGHYGDARAAHNDEKQPYGVSPGMLVYGVQLQQLGKMHHGVAGRTGGSYWDKSSIPPPSFSPE